PVDAGTFNAFPRYPADGTFIAGHDSGRVYRVAGGAPVYINSWDALGGSHPVVEVTQWTIDNGSLGHLRTYPADGTFIAAHPSGPLYRVAGGRPTYTNSRAALGAAHPDATA